MILEHGSYAAEKRCALLRQSCIMHHAIRGAALKMVAMELLAGVRDPLEGLSLPELPSSCARAL